MWGPILAGVAYALAALGPIAADVPAFVAAQRVPDALQPLSAASQVLQRLVASCALVAGFGYALRAGAEPAERTPLALLAVGFALYPVMIQGFVLTAPAAPAGQLLLNALVFGALVVLWLALAERGLGRGAVAAALGLALAALVAAVEGALVADTLARYTLGIGRSIGVALLALAVFRHDILRAGLASRTADRATRASVGLAALFVVAQVAQEYLSSAGGLLLGGILAGVLLFAMTPLQRALEGGGASADAKIATYRDAVRYALREGGMTRKEELHLATLAQQLGLGAADALRVRHEVEDERDGVKPKP